jgi:hypothetical protein
VNVHAGVADDARMQAQAVCSHSWCGSLSCDEKCTNYSAMASPGCSAACCGLLSCSMRPLQRTSWSSLATHNKVEGMECHPHAQLASVIGCYTEHRPLGRQQKAHWASGISEQPSTPHKSRLCARRRSLPVVVVVVFVKYSCAFRL